jgi:hypothetical protein
MNYFKLPSMRNVVENIPLEKAKLDKILAESQSRVASFLDVQYPDSQDIIFLLGGKAVKAGRFFPGGREILTVSQALEKLRHQKQGTISFFEISKLLMIVIMGTFIFEPTHAGLKSKLINFNSLLTLFGRKSFTGYLELRTGDSLNYLTFYGGQPREGYFSWPVTLEQSEFPVKLIAEMVEKADENSEINVYESVGEESLHEKSGQEPAASAAPAEALSDIDGKNQFTSEILDLCLVALYEDLFRIMVTVSNRQLATRETDNLFKECLTQAAKKYPELFHSASSLDDGSLLPGGVINFEHLLKAKSTLPSNQRDQEFLKAMTDLSALRLKAMKTKLAKPLFEQGIADLTDKVASNKKNYQGNFTINKFLYEFSRVLEKARSEGPDGG